MPRAAVNAKTVEPQHEPPAEVLAAYHAHQARTGRGNTAFTYWAKTVLQGGGNNVHRLVALRIEYEVTTPMP